MLSRTSPRLNEDQFAVLPCSLPRRWYPPILPLCVSRVALCSNFVLFLSPLVSFCFIFVFLPFVSAFLWVSCVVLGPPAGHIARNAVFAFLALEALPSSILVPLPSSFLFLSCLPSGLTVSSFCWSINWMHHRTDRTSKQQPCPLGTRPSERMFVSVSFFLLSCTFLPVSFLFTRISRHLLV